MRDIVKRDIDSSLGYEMDAVYADSVCSRPVDTDIEQFTLSTLEDGIGK